MSKENAKRVTFEQLIARRVQREQDQLKITEIYCESLDAYLVFKKPSHNILISVLELIDDGTDIKKSITAFQQLIYHCCEALQNPELHKELGIINPFEIVFALFEVMEVIKIGAELADFCGISNKEKEEKEVIKN